MFKPAFCPWRDCSQHLAPAPHFFLRHGYYHPNCRSRPVPRFRCRACRRTFSRQTFRMDYRDHRPDLNTKLFDLVTMGVGIRMASRRLGLSQRCTELKLRKIARHLRQLNLNLRRPLEGSVEIQFDELESFEGHRSFRPLSIPVLLERSSRYYIWSESAPIRPKGKMTPARLKRLAIEEERHGTRKDRSREACRRTLERGGDLLAKDATVILFTDEKRSYPPLAKAAFGDSLLVHLKTNSKLARTTWNPLFPINHEDARMRDMLGRLRRESWLASKRRRYLDLALHVQMAFRNLIQARFNHDKESPAQLLGFVSRRLTLGEALSWSQRFGKRSRHPLSRRGMSVKEYEMANPVAA